eukprot:7925491-Pyramimonas_sp.AAC.1
MVDHGPPNPRLAASSGARQPIAAKVLVKVLYDARMTTCDLLRAACALASCVAKWTEQQDIELLRFTCCSKASPMLPNGILGGRRARGSRVQAMRGCGLGQ